MREKMCPGLSVSFTFLFSSFFETVKQCKNKSYKHMSRREENRLQKSPIKPKAFSVSEANKLRPLVRAPPSANCGNMPVMPHQ